MSSLPNDREMINAIFEEINTTRIVALEQNSKLVERLERIKDLLVNDAYSNETELEKGYSAFRPHLLNSWMRLYQFKQLGEFDLTNKTSCAQRLFYALTQGLVLGTDGSETCRVNVITDKNGLIIKSLLEDLKSDQFKSLALETIYDNPIQSIAYFDILIILNCLNSDKMLSQLVPLLERGGIVEVIQIYLKSKDPRIRMRAVHLLGYMKNLDKVASIHAEENLPNCVKFLTETIDSKNSSEGCMLHELLRRFCNLSEMKQHADILADAGLLPQLARIVKGKLVERHHWKPANNVDEFCSFEKAIATKCLYPYAIHPTHSRFLLSDSTLINELIRLSKENLGNWKVRQLLKMEVHQFFMALDISITGDMKAKPEGQVEAILSTIDEIKETSKAKAAEAPIVVKTEPVQTASAMTGAMPLKLQSPPSGHIFISYSHKNTQKAMQLSNFLKARGLPVWIDAEAVRGNSVDSMVSGLNNARLVIMCLCEGYRQSDFCKREAEYTVLKKKTFQPVILQEGFRMENDWLCFVVGLQNCIDLSTGKHFEANKEQFLEHVQQLFAGSSSVPAKLANSRSNTTALIAPKPNAAGTETQRVPSGRPKTGQLPSIRYWIISQWNNEQVLEWLEFEKIGILKEKFKENAVDGRFLLQMSRKNKTAPEKLEEQLKEDFGLNSVMCTRVASIIDTLTLF